MTDYREQYQSTKYKPVSFDNRQYIPEPPPEPIRGRNVNPVIYVFLIIPVCAALFLIAYIIRTETRNDKPEPVNLFLILTASAPPEPEQIAIAETLPPIQATPYPSPTPTASPNFELTQTMDAIQREQERINAEATGIAARMTQAQDEADRVALESLKREAELTAAVIDSLKAEQYAIQTGIWSNLTRTAEIENAAGTKTVEEMQLEIALQKVEQNIEIENAKNKSENDQKLQNTLTIILQILLVIGGFFVVGLIFIIYRWERLRRKAASIQERKIARANADRQISDIYKDVDRENAIELWSLLKTSIQYYTDEHKDGKSQIVIPGHHLLKKYDWGGAGKWTRVTDVLSSRHHLRKTPRGSQLVYGNLGDWIQIIQRGYLYDPDPIGKLQLDIIK